MSSSRARSCEAQRPLRNLDEFDLTAFDRRTVCAILLPESFSANHSARLAENDAKGAHIAPYNSLPSPSNSCSEDESSIPRTPSGPKTFRNSSRQKKEKDGSRLVIILEQSRDDEKFNFVSSSGIKGLRTGNDVVLEHPDSENQDNCYINLLHLELYPDPDCDAMVLYNRSTSEFTAHFLPKPQSNKIKPGHRATIERGTWRLTLGKGLTFQIKIFPRPHEELYSSCLCLSPEGADLCVKSSRGSAAAVSTKATAKAEPPTATTSKINDSKKKRYNAKYIGERVSIGKTAFTQVFKANRNGTAVAVKVCRKPYAECSAATWRTELDILTQLDHVGEPVTFTSTELNIQQSSVVRLLGRDAMILSLELEYIGPDLSQSVDEHQLSQLSKDKQYRIWIDVARGIEHIHAQRIIHRDIKPRNILLGGGGRGAVICDFGISTKVYKGPETFNGGTPCYIPPEYLINSPRGFEGDIWAFGVTMLFVFRLIPLPHGDWKIAAINQDLEVRRKMVDWLKCIREAVKIIPEALFPLRAMLAETPTERITADALADYPLVQPLNRTLPA